MDESKKPLKKERMPKLYEMRSLANPYAPFQKGQITKKTVFIRLLQKEDDGYRVIWLYSLNAKRLAAYLLQVVCFLAVNREYEAIKIDSKKDIEGCDFSDLCTVALTHGIFGGVGMTPEIYALLIQGESEYQEAVQKGGDLNIASVSLMNATSAFYYSLTWNLYDYEGALKALKQVTSVPLTKIDGTSFALDKAF